ncbi:hypothetical protein GS399_15210 [Pedobacter sp. HMF7647]|uniref:Outer membrane beta-barrel protein n=1 Tax=Hufsiella arboris TaxID=2695275 RepID=A0A7K1YCL6_9SPHI|nr:hypothetical protein [Hufsiella arboris]
MILTTFCYGNNLLAQKFLIPKNVTIQYAGSIGFISGDFGYNLFKKERGTMDFGYGFVPASKGGPLNILNVKFSYKPFNIKLKEWGNLLPVNPGFFISYHLGSNYHIGWNDDQYPKGYYWWSTALRPNISLSSELKIKPNIIFTKSRMRYISIYTEVSTNELYFISFVQNHDEFPFTNILKLGIGTKLYF